MSNLSSPSGRTEQISPESTGRKTIKIGRHGAEMMMVSDPEKQERMLAQVGVPNGSPTPTTYEERVKLVQGLISKSMGFDLSGSQVPSKIGFDITTDSQRKLLFGVLRLMTETDYRGDVQVPNSQIIKNGDRVVERGLGTNGIDITAKDVQTKGCQVRTGTHIGGPYKNIPSVPVLRITKSDLMKASGFVSNDRKNDERDFGQAMNDLTIKQNFLMWTRFAKDEKGHLKKDLNGRQEFELVSTFSPVLNVNSVSDPQTKTHLYYEISPAPVFLDEISREYGGANGGYFLLIPADSYKEIETAYKNRHPNRKGFTPSTIQALCYWFRLRVQEILNRGKNPFTRKKGTSVLRISYEDLCRQLDYGEQTIKYKKKKILSMLTEGIEIAQELGFINQWTFDSETEEYLFHLNMEYYPNEYKREAPDEQKQIE